jgi:hypothetical protein
LYLWRAWNVVAAPLEDTVAVLPDDAFYYLRIAQHIAAGDGSTFDGINRTNGYHPLWMLLLVGLARIVPDSLDYIRAAQALALSLHAAGSLILWALLRRNVSERWSLVASSVWLLAPWGIVQAAQAMESALYQACVFALLLMHQVVEERVLRGERLPPLAYGAAMAAVVLARTDGAILCGLSVTLLAFRIIRGPAQYRRHALDLAKAVVWSVVIWSPWALSSIHAVGTVVQDSVAMKSLRHAQGATLFGEPRRGVVDVLSGRWFNQPLELLAGGVIAGTGVTVIKGLLVCAIGYASMRRLGEERLWGLVILVVAWAVVAGVAFGAALGDLQLWHLVPPTIALFVSAALVVPLVTSRNAAVARPDLHYVPAMAVAIFYLLMTWQTARLLPKFYPWQTQVYRSTPRFNAWLVPTDRLGAFNAGIPGYFSNRPVVNLDGLVNHAVGPFWQNARWDEYLAVAGITHIADEASSLKRALKFSASVPALAKLDEYAMEGWQDDRRTLWKVVAQKAGP